MGENQNAVIETRLSRMGERMRKETAQWLTIALRTGVKPRKDYVRLVQGMHGKRSGDPCGCLDSLKQVCNAA